MQRHESYKPSGVKWLGDIPSHWNLKKSKFLWREKEDRSTHGDEELLSVSQYLGVVPRKNESRSESLEDYKRCEPNDLVINIMLAWMSGLGVSRHSGIVSPAYCVYRQLEDHNPNYLDYLYRTPQYLAEFARRSKGIVPSRWRMYTEDFGQVPSLLPPRDEQDQIVALLDQRAAEIDAAIVKKERLIQLLEESKRSLINQAVTGGLSGNAPLVPTGLSWFPVAPAHWKLKRLKTISSFITSGPRGWSERLSDEGAVFLQSGNLNDSFGIDMESAHRVVVPKGAEAKRTLIHEGDVLICITGANTGRIAVANTGVQEAYINQHLSLARLKEANPRFVAYSLSAQGSTYFMLCQYGLKEGLSLFDVANAPILLPSLDEQKEIVAFLDQGAAKIDRAMAAGIKQCQQLEELKRTMIAEAVTGRQVQ
jgi:type I restriction enzyme S subunit